MAPRLFSLLPRPTHLLFSPLQYGNSIDIISACVRFPFGATNRFHSSVQIGSSFQSSTNKNYGPFFLSNLPPSLLNVAGYRNGNFTSGAAIFYESRRYKGHSHWQNIAKTKQANDMAKSMITTRLMIRLRSAVWRNNNEINPKFNKDLANVLDECTANNVPKDTVNRALDRLKSAPPAQIHRYDICGRSGIYLVVEIETPVKVRTRNLLQKLCAKLSDFGVIDRAPGEGFQETGIVRIFRDSNAAKADLSDQSTQSGKVPPAALLELSDAETLAIELECEEVREVAADTEQDTPAMFEFICAPENVDRVASGLRVRGYSVQSSDVDFIPYPAPVKVSPAMQQSVKNLYAQLEQFEGPVGRIFDNIDWDDE